LFPEQFKFLQSWVAGLSTAQMSMYPELSQVEVSEASKLQVT
jgi:hypothetical protein